MGFFSWRCAKSGESIAVTMAMKPLEQSDCVLVTPIQLYHEPYYAGYGDFADVDIYELLGDGDRSKGITDYHAGNAPFDVKIVLSKYYEGEPYDELPVSETCEYQGYFYD